MATPTDWLTPEDVARWLDPNFMPGDPLAEEDNLLLATAAVKAAIERRRSDLWDRSADPPIFAADDELHGGAVRWAALYYQTRGAPSGYAGYGDQAPMFDSLGANRAEIMRAVGWRRPVAT